MLTVTAGIGSDLPLAGCGGWAQTTLAKTNNNNTAAMLIFLTKLTAESI
jgi:hypothetical protein